MVHSFTPMGAISVEKTVFWYIAVDREQRLVRLTRTEAPYVESSEIGASFVAIDRVLIEIDRKHHRLLVDMRDGPRRNDTEFETTIARYRKSLFLSFHRVAVLVRTATGLLQVKRHIQQDGAIHSAVFMAEPQAMQHLDR